MDKCYFIRRIQTKQRTGAVTYSLMSTLRTNLAATLRCARSRSNVGAVTSNAVSCAMSFPARPRRPSGCGVFVLFATSPYRSLLMRVGGSVRYDLDHRHHAAILMRQDVAMEHILAG